jgi:hypothetical protein
MPPLVALALAVGALLLVAVLVRRADRDAKRQRVRLSIEGAIRISRGARVTEHRFKLGDNTPKDSA